jgi:hypothetical protein
MSSTVTVTGTTEGLNRDFVSSLHFFTSQEDQRDKIVIAKGLDPQLPTDQVPGPHFCPFFIPN